MKGRRHQSGRFLGLVCALVATCVVVLLAGCADLSHPNMVGIVERYVGSWELNSGTFDEGEVSEEDYQEMVDTLDMHATLDLDSKGNLLVDAFGSQQTGTWMMDDETTLILTLDGEDAEAVLEDDLLTLTYEGESLSFEKVSDTPDMDRDPSENAGRGAEVLGLGEDAEDADDPDDPEDVATPEQDVEEEYVEEEYGDLSELVEGLFSDVMFDWSEAYVQGVSETASLDVAICDDDVACIRVVGLGEDSEGDTGYLLEIENRTAVPFAALNLDTTLDGADVYDYATLGCPVRAGEMARAFFYFEREACVVTPESACEFTVLLLSEEGEFVGYYQASV